MPPRAAVAFLAAAPIALIACAGPRGAPPQVPRPAARAPFEPAAGDAVFEQALHAAALAGYRIRTCDADRWRFDTEPIEFDAPCGPTTCLARQSVEVKLGYRVARVTVERELLDGSYRTWEVDALRQSIDAARALLDTILTGFAPDDRRERLVRARDRWADPRLPDPCRASSAARLSLVASSAPLR